MLLSVNDTMGYGLAAEDGDVGKVSDLLFDDASSKVRYLVIDTGGWLFGRQVLLAPAACGEIRPDSRTICTALTQQQVKDSPPIGADKPVSRQEEETLHRYYGWTPYWDSSMAPGVPAAYWGAIPVVPTRDPKPVTDEALAAEAERGDPHLRSANEVIGYYIGAKDGDIGHVEDLLMGEKDWMVRYLVIDTRNWLPGKKVLVATDWLTEVDWAGRKIAVDLERERIKASPEYDPAKTLDRSYQERLYRHYGRDALSI